MRLHVGIPIFFPTIALITKLALEWFHTKVLIHVLTKISGFKETFLTSAMQFSKVDHLFPLKQIAKDTVYLYGS